MADDFFALLGEPRRPYLDPEQVKEAFHQLSRSWHPDQSGPTGGVRIAPEGAFAKLNQAQATLQDPKARLRHLLEIEFPGVRVTGPATVPSGLVALFAPVHRLLHEVDALLAKKAATSSALGRALLAREELALREQAEERLAELDALNASALDELRGFDARWEPRQPDASGQLLQFYQRFAYLSRWSEQLRERLFQLGA